METLVIKAIPAPTDESEARKRVLWEEEKHRTLTEQERYELLSLEMRQFWNCEC